MTVQVPLPGMPGGVQLAWGLPALQAAAKAKRDAPADPAQLVLPCFGVMPGASWRQHTAKCTGLERLPAHYLELRRPRRAEAWTPSDLCVRAEVRARTITLHTALRWSAGAGVPGWFTGFVPKRLRQLVALVWTAYRRGSFGLRDTQNSWAAFLDVCPRTVGNHIRLGVKLGLLSAVQLWTEKDGGGTWRDVVLLRPGWALESLAGLAAFEHGRGPRQPMRASFPGGSRDVMAGRSSGAERRRQLTKAAARLHADQRHRHYQARERGQRAQTLHSCPELFASYLADVLPELEPELEPEPCTSKKTYVCETTSPPAVRPATLAPPEPEPEPEPELVDDWTCPSWTLPPAGDVAPPRTSAPSRGRPSDATGDHSAPCKRQATPAAISPQRKNLPNKHTPLPSVGSLRQPQAATDEKKKEFPPVASDGRPRDGADVRGGATSPAILKRWQDGELTPEQRSALARVERQKRRAPKPPPAVERAGAAPGVALDGPSKFAALLPAGYWLPDDDDA